MSGGHPVTKEDGTTMTFESVLLAVKYGHDELQAGVWEVLLVPSSCWAYFT